MALSDWSERQLLGLTAAVVGAVLVVMAGMVCWIYLRHRTLTAEIKVKNVEVRNAEKISNTFDEVRKRRDEVASEFHEILKLLPPKTQLADLMALISAQANSAGLSIKKIDPPREERTRRGGGRKVAGGRYKPMKLDIEAEGSFLSIVGFFKRIEQEMERFVAVKGFKIKAYKDGLAPGKGPLKLDLELETYRSADKRAPGGAAR